MSITTVKWSVAEYHRLVALGVSENKSVELFQGEIVEIVPEGPRHSNRIRQTTKAIRRLFTI
ncbi:MAG: hypothetical protein HC890_13655 [Chloroflexaceae bacterium]|nr:hypothetical protein [Chloroflexaceae bacterium]